MMGLIIVIMAFSFDTLKVHAETNYDSFPYGYREKLREINQLHPNWTFVPFNTGLEWDRVVEGEMVGQRSLVYYNVKDSWKSKDPEDYNSSTGEYTRRDNGNWVRASREAVEYHLNPINYLDEKHVFAFEQLKYNPDIHNAAGVEAVIANSWMSHRPLEDQPYSGFYYSDFFIESARNSEVSPYHLASRVLQEMGRGDVVNKTNSNPLISGKNGVYNYFNFGATGKSNDEIIRKGEEYARRNGWTTRSLALIGGAETLGAQYINQGQDTIYLEKFDVDSSASGLYYHQYQQNLQAPMSESGSVYVAYEKCNLLDSNFIFKIPIYNNMPGNEPPVSYEKVSQFVTRLYNVCLGRNPEPGGVEYWSELLVNHNKTGSQVAEGFIFSNEFKEKNYCNSCYVKHLYNAFLGREYDEAGLQYWIAELESGKTREFVFNGFVMSPEFAGICEDYGIDHGDAINIPQYGTIPRGDCSQCGHKNDVSLFVKRLYNICLDREPDMDGMDYYCNYLWNREKTGTQVAYGFVFSPEFTEKNYDNVTFVEYMYNAFLDRESEEAGRNYWLEKMDNGATREEIFRGFAQSPEFIGICNKYGISN